MTKMTAAQAWALQAIADGYNQSPGTLGGRMMERPGAVPERRGKVAYKAQGYGRMGGVMMERLRKMGLVDTTGWPTRAELTSRGRARLSEVAAHLAAQIRENDDEQ